jgi:hypothetical protein
MLTAAKHINAYWFPQAVMETAIYLKVTQGVSFADAEDRVVVGKMLSSGSGSGAVHQWLQDNHLLAEAAGQGNGCSN